MPVTDFSHYNLKGSRELLDELRTFYCDVVGLRLGPRPPLQSFGYWLYAGERAVLHLSESRPGEPRERHAAATFDHAAFACTDRSAHEQVLARHGIPFRVAQVPQTRQVQVFFSDPAGNGVELNFVDAGA